MREKLLAYLKELGENQINLTSEGARSQVATDIINITHPKFTIHTEHQESPMEQIKQMSPYDYKGE